MTPKDKAKYLVDIYYYYLFQSDVIQRTYWSKQCSLIAVDEILNYLKVDGFSTQIDYWNEVRNEINKL